MVHMPPLNSRVMSSTKGELPVTLIFLNISFSKPSFFANIYIMSWSGLDSKTGFTTLSRHCKERFDAVTEPEVSNCVDAGSR